MRKLFTSEAVRVWGVPVVSSGAAATAGHTAVKASAMAHTALSRRR